MAVRKPPTIEPINPEELSLSQLNNHEAEIYDEEDEINNVLAELGGENDAKINVYKIDPGKQQAFVGSFAPSNFSVETLQMTYGAGDYSVQVRSGGRIRTRRNISIAEPLRQNQLQVLQPQNVDNKLVDVMNDGFKQLATMFLDGLNRLATNQPQPKSTTDTLHELALMKQVLGGGNNSENGLDQFMKGLEFAKQITPREGEPSGSEVLMKAVETFAPILQTMKENQSHSFPGQIPTYVPQNLPVQNPVDNLAPLNKPENLPESDPVSLQESIYLNLLVQNAKADNDPTTYANMALDILGTEKALEYVNHPDYLKILLEKKPEAEPYMAWFIEFKDLVNELSKEPLTVEPENAINNASIGVQPESGKDAVPSQ